MFMLHRQCNIAEIYILKLIPFLITDFRFRVFHLTVNILCFETNDLIL